MTVDRDLFLGIDFGTSNSSVSVFRNGRATVLPLGRDGATTIPSILFFPAAGGDCAVGQEAIDAYLETNLQGRLMQSIKAFLPDPGFTGTAIHGWGRLTIEDLVLKILAVLKSRAEALIGQSVHSVVMGRPAVFSSNPDEERIAQRRLLHAAQRAGFTDIRFQLEPIAAALTYELTLTRPELVFVGDFGGGTSDFTLMRLDPGRVGQADRHEDILAVDGVSTAGDAFNSAIMWHRLIKHFGYGARYLEYGDRWFDVPVHFFHAICSWHRIALLKNRKDQEFLERMVFASTDPKGFERLQTLINDNLAYLLFRQIQEAKCTLSSRDHAAIRFNRGNIAILKRITAAGFERMIASPLETIGRCIDRTLAAVEVEPEAIQAVFLTGGTSQTPCVRQLMAEKFGEHKLRPGNAFTSVAQGLALSAPRLAGQPVA